MADCNFLQKAIAIVTQATELDAKREYAEAFQKYQLALEYFMTALKCIYSFYNWYYLPVINTFLLLAR